MPRWRDRHRCAGGRRSPAWHSGERRADRVPVASERQSGLESEAAAAPGDQDPPDDGRWPRGALLATQKGVTIRAVPLDGEYEPSPAQWVRDQVETYERSRGQEANTLLDTGLPVIIVTTRGNKSGKLRKTPLMRVEHGGEYALVASQGGAPSHPVWYHNLQAGPEAVTIQDGPDPFDAQVREVSGEERAAWWERSVAAYPPYAEYQTKTDREIPVFVASRCS